MRSYEEIVHRSGSRLWNVSDMMTAGVPAKFVTCGMYGGLIKLPDCGTCSVIWSDSENGYEHVSVSPKHKFRIPTWDDMCYLKDTFFDDEEEVYQIMPKKSEYVNLKENCLHLWRPKNGKTIKDLVLLEE